MIHFLPEAVLEAEAAKHWYGERDIELGLAFEDAVINAVNRIEEGAERWPTYMHGTRRFRLRRFPYAIVYLHEPGDQIWVVAVAHQRRRPGYWAQRISAIN